MPYYKGADVVAEAVSSALDQTLPADEIVICDDGSPDDLGAALGALADRVRIVRKENGGPASAMNEAARQAAGEYVLQLDQDDLFLPGRVEAISDAIVSRPDLDVVATGGLVELDGELVEAKKDFGAFVVDDQRLGIVERQFFAWPAMRRERLLEVGGYDESFFHAYDWEGFIRLILTGSRAGLVDEPLYRWRLSSGSVSSEGSRNAEEYARVLRKTRDTMELTPEESEAVSTAITANERSVIIFQAREALADGRPDARRRCLEVVLGRGFGAATRAKALAAIVFPRAAGRRIVDQFERSPTKRRFGFE
jgi:glycosyltransferase involved in cell wall biosynthesis